MKNIIAIILIFTVQFAVAQQVIKLYEGKAEGSETWDWTEKVSEADQNIWGTKLVYNVVDPTMLAYLPADSIATGTAMVIAPGGGFFCLSIDSEGIELAKWLQQKGVAAFVLKYRLAKCLTNDPGKEFMERKSMVDDAIKASPLAMVDGMEAIKYVRDRSEAFGIKKDQIGLIGFSAGGSLTLNVAMNARFERKPNFIAPIYPWNVGQIVDEVPKDTMPMFLAVAQDDPLELMQHSLDMYEKWASSGQPAELHVYQQGGHGFGMRTQNLPSDSWYLRFGDWLAMNGFLKTKL